MALWLYAIPTDARDNDITIRGLFIAGQLSILSVSTTSAASAACATSAAKAATSSRRVAPAGVEAAVGISSIMVCVIVISVRCVIPVGIYIVTRILVAGILISVSHGAWAARIEIPYTHAVAGTRGVDRTVGDGAR